MPLPRSLTWPLCMLALCAVIPTAQAATHAKHPAAKPHASTGTDVSLLKGALRFTLPTGYKSEPLPPGDAGTGTAGAKGTLYMSDAEKRIVVATELPIQGAAPAAKDDSFLTGASAGFISKQAQALPDFHTTQEQRVTLHGLAAQRIDATATVGGGKTLNTYFIAAQGQQLAVVQVISRINDNVGHETAVKRVIKGKP
jgi:hypothetical protein